MLVVYTWFILPNHTVTVCGHFNPFHAVSRINHRRMKGFGFTTLVSRSQVFHCKARNAKCFVFMQNGNHVINVRCIPEKQCKSARKFVCKLSVTFAFISRAKKRFFPAPRFSCFSSSFFPLLVRLLLGYIPAEVLAKPAGSKMTSSYSWRHLVKLWTMPLIMIRNFWYEVSVFLCYFFFSWRVCFPIHIMLNLKDHQYLVCMVRAEEIERTLTR